MYEGRHGLQLFVKQEREHALRLSIDHDRHNVTVMRNIDTLIEGTIRFLDKERLRCEKMKQHAVLLEAQDKYPVHVDDSMVRWSMSAERVYTRPAPPYGSCLNVMCYDDAGSRKCWWASRSAYWPMHADESVYICASSSALSCHYPRA